MSDRACVRDEATTREKRGLVGNGKELPSSSGVTWCGRDVSLEWLYQGADHVIDSLRRGDGITPCPKCIRVLRDRFDYYVTEE